MKFIRKIIANSSLSLMSLVFFGLIVSGCIYFYMIIQLPDVGQLRDMRMQVPLRIFSSDGKVIGEFGEKKRIPITLKQVPPKLITAILDTEDQRFYEHKGVDFIGLLRAAKTVFLSGKKTQGASTITMQVARNFFLSPDKTYKRKINEILLAMKIDNLFSKKEILELYVNKIYLGQRAYGVAAAAQVYYGKTLQELTLPEMATLAGLPQAPSRDNPIANPEGALERRNHVLERMLENGHITMVEYKVAVAAPIVTRSHELATEVQAPYVAEMVRNAMVAQYGDDAYDNGYKVYTTIDSHAQSMANKAIRDGLLAYDKRHGYRGAEKHFGADRDSWREKLKDIPVVNGLYPAVVIASDDVIVHALLNNGETLHLSGISLIWNTKRVIGLKPGDLIRVQKSEGNQWQIAQMPKVEGALVALDTKNGAVLALVGGFSYAGGGFNRAIQANRQTGSGFKPFLYSAALEKGYTLASIINDAPITIVDPATHAVWQPQNDTQQFYGPTRLRVGLMESRNLVSVRLLQEIGVPYAADYVERFGFTRDEVPRMPSLALGTAALSPMKVATGFAVFANGGYKVTPFFIDKIADRDNKTLFTAQPLGVPSSDKPSDKNFASRVLSQQNAYLMTSALKDVISYGTAKRAAVLKRADLAGKTGTSNDEQDAWFTGFNGDLVVTVWVGIDQPQTIYEHGSQAALPIWMQFVGEVLAGKPEHSMVEPSGITTARIDPKTGLLAYPGQKNAVFEVFTTETAPKETAQANEDVDGQSSGATPIDQVDVVEQNDQGISMSPSTDEGNHNVPQVEEKSVPAAATANPQSTPVPKETVTKPATTAKENEPLF